ncbi:hypothetical protein CL615_01360 [archaeon]|nr:hypothetical protein [archaeon]
MTSSLFYIYASSPFSLIIKKEYLNVSEKLALNRNRLSFLTKNLLPSNKIFLDDLFIDKGINKYISEDINEDISEDINEDISEDINEDISGYIGKFIDRFIY